MVWIYGGVYFEGEANTFPPANFVKHSDQPIVVVTFNYRVNVFGFLGAKALAARSPDGTTGNYGIQDQRLAMQWVRSHIAAFGGKQNDVTIFGESSGGNSVLHHLVQPASFGLYDKAIMESGTYDGGYSLKDAEAMYVEISARSGCVKSTLECLLKLSPSKMVWAANETRYSSDLPMLHFGPTVDGVSMVATPQKLIAQGKFNNKVPVLLGSNRDEFAAFVNSPSQTMAKYYPKDMTEVQFDALLAYLGTDGLKTVKRLYDPSAYSYPTGCSIRGPIYRSQWWWTAMRIATDNGIPVRGWPIGPALGHCSARRIAHQLLQGGSPSVYMYHFEKVYANSCFSMHGMELPFVWHWSPLLGVAPGNRKLATAMTNYWTHFAASGSPNLNGTDLGLPHWPAYSFGQDSSKLNLKFDASFSRPIIEVQQNLRGDACDFWDSLAATGRPAPPTILV
jgi:para-nitrobenzyl esterase